MGSLKPEADRRRRVRVRSGSRRGEGAAEKVFHRKCFGLYE